MTPAKVTLTESLRKLLRQFNPPAYVQNAVVPPLLEAGDGGIPQMFLLRMLTISTRQQAVGVMLTIPAPTSEHIIYPSAGSGGYANHPSACVWVLTTPSKL